MGAGALTALASFGIGRLNGLGAATKAGNSVGKTYINFYGRTVGTSVSVARQAVNSVLSNVANQQINRAFGLQKGFNWRSVGSSYVGARVGSSVSGGLGKPTDLFDKLVKSTVANSASQAVRATLENRSFSFKQTAISTVGNVIANDFIEGQVEIYKRREAAQNRVGPAFDGDVGLRDNGGLDRGGQDVPGTGQTIREGFFWDTATGKRLNPIGAGGDSLPTRGQSTTGSSVARDSSIRQGGEDSNWVDNNNPNKYGKDSGGATYSPPVKFKSSAAWGARGSSQKNATGAYSAGTLVSPSTTLLPVDLFEKLTAARDLIRSGGLTSRDVAKKLIKRGLWAILPGNLGSTSDVTWVDVKNKNREYTYSGNGDDVPETIKVTDYVSIKGQRIKAVSWTFDLRSESNAIDYDGVQVAEIVQGEVVPLGNLSALRPETIYPLNSAWDGTWNPSDTKEKKSDAKGRELEKGEIILAGGITVTGWSSINRKTAKQGSYTIFFRDEDGYVVKYHGRGSFARMTRSAALRARTFNSKVIDFNWTANDGSTIAQNVKNSKKDEAARIWHYDAGPQLNVVGEGTRTANLRSNTVNVNIYGGKEPTGRNYNAVFTGVKYLYWAREAVKNPASLQGWPLSVSRPSPDGHPSYDPKNAAQRDRMKAQSKKY